MSHCWIIWFHWYGVKESACCLIWYRISIIGIKLLIFFVINQNLCHHKLLSYSPLERGTLKFSLLPVCGFVAQLVVPGKHGMKSHLNLRCSPRKTKIKSKQCHAGRLVRNQGRFISGCVMKQPNLTQTSPSFSLSCY